MQNSPAPPVFSKMKQAGEKIAMLTAYDATFARIAQAAGVDCLLVGDSLGMVVQGKKDTISVRVADIAYHLRAVRAGAPETCIIGDMPFGSFQESPQKAYANAARLLAADAQMVKIEGGENMQETVSFLTARGIPVCAHVGLLPQFIRADGSYKVQGRDEAGAAQVRRDARAMQEAGAAMIVLELLPADLAATITAELTVPTIGIGSGSGCDGQVLVLHDMLGLAPSAKKFVKNFLAETAEAADAGGASIADAIRRYVDAVKQGAFPDSDHSF